MNFSRARHAVLFALITGATSCSNSATDGQAEGARGVPHGSEHPDGSAQAVTDDMLAAATVASAQVGTADASSPNSSGGSDSSGSGLSGTNVSGRGLSDRDSINAGSSPVDLDAGQLSVDVDPGSMPVDPLGDAGKLEPSSSRLGDWLYVYTASGGRVMSVRAPEQQIPITDLSNALVEQNVPWSPDGTRLAQVDGGSVVFYALEAEQARVVAQYVTSDYDSVYAWIPKWGPALRGTHASATVGAMNEDGDVLVLADTNGPFDLRIDPRGAQYFYTVYSSPSDVAYWRRGISQGQLEDPVLIADHLGAVPTREIWAPESQWVAYAAVGASGAGAVYFWQAGAQAPLEVGSPYAPHFSFSKDGSKFAYQTSSETQVSLYSVAVESQSFGDANLVDTSGSMSEGVWNGYGQLMYVDDDGGWLQPFDENAVPLPRTAFPGYTTDCSVSWFDETHFVRYCSDTTLSEFGSVHDGSITTSQFYRGSLDRLEVAFGGKCLLTASPQFSGVGVAQLNSSGLRRLTNSSAIEFTMFSPDGEYVVWTENGTQLYRAQITGCFPGDPTLLLETNEPIQLAAFLPTVITPSSGPTGR